MDMALDEVTTIQQTILQAMRDGATYSTAHKEGGAVIRFHARRFVYAEYGDYETRREFASDTEFLAFLREFFEYRIVRPAGSAAVSEADAWRQILQQLEPQRRNAVAGLRMDRRTVTAVVAALALAALLAYLKFSPKADALRAGMQESKLERMQPPPAAPEQKDWQRMQDELRRGVEAAKAAARAATR